LLYAGDTNEAMIDSESLLPPLRAAVQDAVYSPSLLLRTPFPVDETRYLSVAWEMWHNGDFILPTLNGEPYSHKPPLLFWLMHAGWALFGVNDYSPRLISMIAGLASLPLVSAIAGFFSGRIVLASAQPLR